MCWWSDLRRAGPAADGTRRPRVVVSIYDDPGNPYYAGGGPLVVGRIVESLAHRYEVVVVTGGHRGARRASRHSATYLPLPLGWAGPRLGQLLYTACLLVLVRVAAYDLWVESFTPPFSSSFLPMLTRRPVIGVAQALSGREMARRYHSGLFLVIERWALRAYSDVVVLNEHDRRQVLACHPHGRVHVIQNVTEFVVPDSAECAENGQYALFMGRIDFEQKGLHLLFKAYQQLGDKAPPLVIAGSGRQSELRTLRAALKAAGPQVRWVGAVSGQEKEDLLSGCAFVIVPSMEESFCMVALEALAHGRPVVRFDLPQLAWIPDDCGVTVPRFDVAGLGVATLQLAGDLELRARAAGRALAFAREFVRSQPADTYVRLADEVLAGTATGHRGMPARRWA